MTSGSHVTCDADPTKQVSIEWHPCPAWAGSCLGRSWPVRCILVFPWNILTPNFHVFLFCVCSLEVLQNLLKDLRKQQADVDSLSSLELDEMAHVIASAIQGGDAGGGQATRGRGAGGEPRGQVDSPAAMLQGDLRTFGPFDFWGSVMRGADELQSCGERPAAHCIVMDSFWWGHGNLY